MGRTAKLAGLPTLDGDDVGEAERKEGRGVEEKRGAGRRTVGPGNQEDADAEEEGDEGVGEEDEGEEDGGGAEVAAVEKMAGGFGVAGWAGGVEEAVPEVDGPDGEGEGGATGGAEGDGVLEREEFPPEDGEERGVKA